MVGKYVDLTESYKSLIEALRHAGIYNQTKVNIRYIDSEQIEKSGIDCLQNLDAILVPGALVNAVPRVKFRQFVMLAKIKFLT